MSVHVDFSKMYQIQRELPKKIVVELNNAAQSMESLAKQLAPVDTGYMKEHITQTKHASESDLSAQVESEADYSLFVEYGTVNMDAQPFFTPAFESARRQVNNNLKRVLQFRN